MSTLQAELRRIRKHLEATRKKLPSSPEMPEDSEETLTFREQLSSENQAKSWEEHKESK